MSEGRMQLVNAHRISGGPKTCLVYNASNGGRQEATGQAIDLQSEDSTKSGCLVSSRCAVVICHNDKWSLMLLRYYACSGHTKKMSVRDSINIWARTPFIYEAVH